MTEEYDYEYFKNEILKLTGINLHYYKEKQMKRRINTLIERKHFSGYESYICELEKNPEELAYFINYITINVTEFFRTAEHWKYFEENILKELAAKKGRQLKIWSCACSTGEEPYSLVMSMAKYLPLDQIKVTATDIDREALKQAEAGNFFGKSVESIPDELMQKFFSRAAGGWKISEEVRKCVEFKQLDLLQDDYPEEQDLIVCRNVLIYFTEEAKNKIYSKFQESLSNGGYLFTGNTEQIILYKKIGFTKIMNYIYKK